MIYKSKTQFFRVFSILKCNDGLNEEVHKKLVGILNKLTPENFEILLSQILILPFHSTTEIECLVDRIIKKALDDSLYTCVYAKLCKELSRSSNFCSEETFKDVLLRKCVQHPYWCFNPSDNTTQPTSFSTAGESEDVNKKNYLALCRFIAELYKCELLSEELIYNYIEAQGDSELVIESLCKLLSHVGPYLQYKSLVSPEFEQKWDSCWHRLTVGHESVSTRVRFLIEDVKELKENDWSPLWRHQYNRLLNPMTLHQVKIQHEAQILGVAWEGFTGEESATELEEKLLKLLHICSSKTDFQQCIKSVIGKTASHVNFISALTRAILRYYLTERSRITQKSNDKRCILPRNQLKLLKDFIAGRQTLEEECCLAVENFHFTDADLLPRVKHNLITSKVIGADYLSIRETNGTSTE